VTIQKFDQLVFIPGRRWSRTTSSRQVRSLTTWSDFSSAIDPGAFRQQSRCFFREPGSNPISRQLKLNRENCVLNSNPSWIFELREMHYRTERLMKTNEMDGAG